MDIAALLNEHSIGLASYSEVSIESGRAPITLSIWEAEQDAAPTVVFVPGTMTHPLFYSPFLDAVSRHGYHVVGVHPLSHGCARLRPCGAYHLSRNRHCMSTLPVICASSMSLSKVSISVFCK